MANYKKLTDVEVMEEVSENSMALVNENGVLKQVPCGAGFGGGKWLVIVENEDTSEKVANMTPEEFINGFNDGSVVGGVLHRTTGLSEGDGNAYIYFLGDVSCYSETITMTFYRGDLSYLIGWHYDGLWAAEGV